MEIPFEYLCPWCSETSTSFFDLSMGSCSYLEDCQVCCRVIEFYFTVSEKNELKEVKCERA